MEDFSVVFDYPGSVGIFRTGCLRFLSTTCFMMAPLFYVPTLHTGERICIMQAQRVGAGPGRLGFKQPRPLIRGTKFLHDEDGQF